MQTTKIITSILISAVLFVGFLGYQKINQSKSEVSFIVKADVDELTVDDLRISVYSVSLRDTTAEWTSPIRLTDPVSLNELSSTDRIVSSVESQLAQKKYDQMRLQLTRAVAINGALETDVDLLSDILELPINLDLRQYDEVEVLLELIVGSNFAGDDNGSYSYTPHIMITSKDRSSAHDLDASHIFQTEVSQTREGSTMFGAPNNFNSRQSDEPSDSDIELPQAGSVIEEVQADIRN